MAAKSKKPASVENTIGPANTRNIIGEIETFLARNPHIDLSDFLENVGIQLGLISRA
ncbi:MAG: hypothetical protein AB7K41_14535 [Bdellovibrionales bacterium]